MGSSYESRIYNNQWCITCCPNSNKGNVILCLQLICLPQNICKLKVQYTLRCELGTVWSTESTNIKNFEYEQGKSYGLWTASKKLSFEQFKQYDSITLSADIQILDEIECNSIGDSEEEIEAKWQNYIAQKEHFYDISAKTMHCYYGHATQNNYQMERRLDALSEQMCAVMNGIATLNQSMRTLECRNRSLDADLKRENAHVNVKHDEIWKWLKDIVGLECYYDLFIEHGLEHLDILSSLRMNDLISIGIDKLGHRLKIMKCIALLAQAEEEIS